MSEALQRENRPVRALEALPPLPAVALRVLQVSQDQRASASDLALVISSDPGLSARILRIANSAAYRRLREVASVQEALVVLGFTLARNVAISSAITSAYAREAPNAMFRISEFWRHSIAVALKASELAAQSRQIDMPAAFTAGILHNIGRLAMFHADPAAVDKAVEFAVSRGTSLEDAESEVLGLDHAEIGGELARRWNLPEDIVAAIERHHDVEIAESTLASVVSQADQYCMSIGLLPGYVADEEPADADIEAEHPPEAIRLLRQVDALMEMVSGRPDRVVEPAA